MMTSYSNWFYFCDISLSLVDPGGSWGAGSFSPSKQMFLACQIKRFKCNGSSLGQDPCEVGPHRVGLRSPVSIGSQPWIRWSLVLCSVGEVFAFSEP